LRLPWAACLAAALLMAPSWWLLRAGARARELRKFVERGPGDDAVAALVALVVGRSAVWWWLVLILAAIALRQLMSI